MASSRTNSLKAHASRAAAVATMAVMLIVGGASAVQASPGAGGAEANGASVKACSTVSGGTWCRGSAVDGSWKLCYSNYKHNSRYHSSTASIANQSVTRYANAGYWSYAEARAGFAYTCHAYYNSNP